MLVGRWVDEMWELKKKALAFVSPLSFKLSRFLSLLFQIFFYNSVLIRIFKFKSVIYRNVHTVLYTCHTLSLYLYVWYIRGCRDAHHALSFYLTVLQIWTMSFFQLYFHLLSDENYLHKSKTVWNLVLQSFSIKNSSPWLFTISLIS